MQAPSTRDGGAPDPERVLVDLLYLRKGVGYSDKRLLARQALVRMLGGPAEPIEVLRERLMSAIHSLDDADEAILLAVFGLDGVAQSSPTLTSRRDRVAKELGLRREAVADRDARALERLLHQLCTGWYPKSPVGIRIPESHNGVVQQLVRIQTVVNNRKHELTRHHYRFMCTFDGAEYLTIATAEPGLVQVTLGDYALRVVPVERGVLLQFWHGSPFVRGRVYDLGFVVRNPDPVGDPRWLTEESLAFHEPTRRAVFEVKFKGAVPARVWSFAGLTGTERPGPPSRLLQWRPGPKHIVQSEYRDLFGGLYGGVAWEYSTVDTEGQ